ncbi:MAG: FAD:protein FMN transferase [Acidobacteriota bacterium]
MTFPGDTSSARATRGRGRPVYRHSSSLMGTVLTIEVVMESDAESVRHDVEQTVDDAMGWCRGAEDVCSRFDPHSELRRLIAQPGVPVHVSPMLYEVLQFAIACAEASGGAFDPTIGARMEARGFTRHYQSGVESGSGAATGPDVTYRDVEIDAEHLTVTLRRPLVLDLGGVAKGLAVDLAASALREYRNFVVDAGGDLFLSGLNAHDEPWRVGIRHPRREGETIAMLRVSNRAVCTSGDYERRSGADGHSHLMDARTSQPALAAVSATVLAPTAIVADAFATAAFALGPAEGIAFLAAHDVDGLIVDASLGEHATTHFSQVRVS